VNPSDARALEIGRLVLQVAALLGAAETSAPATFTQHFLPPECPSADAFLRLHRSMVKAEAPGWHRRGQTRAVDASAWATYLQDQTAKRPRRPKLQELAVDELDHALGIRPRRVGQ
jgi:hypothetical protein